MDYFRLEQIESVAIRKKETVMEEGAVICKLEDIQTVRGIDYLEAEERISDRLKRLLESFLPEKEWKPYLFIDMEKQEQEAFWKRRYVFRKKCGKTRKGSLPECG